MSGVEDVSIWHVIAACESSACVPHFISRCLLPNMVNLQLCDHWSGPYASLSCICGWYRGLLVAYCTLEDVCADTEVGSLISVVVASCLPICITV